MRDKSNPTVEQIVGTLGKIFDKLPVKPEVDLTFSLAFIRAVAHLREMQLEEAETRIEQLEEQVANSSFAKAEEYRVELEATQALLENGILWKTVGRIAEGRKSEGGISETVINEIAKRLIGSLVPPEQEEDGVKKIRVKIGEDRNGEAIVKWACGRTIEQFISSIVQIHIDNGLLDDFISPPVVHAVIPVETSNLGKNGRRVKFGEYAESWLTVYHKQKVIEKTFKTDKGYISKHLISYFGEKYLHEITVHGFQEFLNSRAKMKNPKGQPLAHKTIHHIWGLAKQIFDTAVEEELIIKAPTQSKKLTNPSDIVTERKALTKEEAQAIAGALPHIEKQMDRRLLALLVYTGMRRGEILALRWEDVIVMNPNQEGEGILAFDVKRSISFPDNNQPKVKATKTKKGMRKVTIVKSLWEHLQPAQTSGYIVHRDADGTEPISSSTYDRMVQRLEKQIELHDAHAHDFRHTYITLMAEEGVPLPIIQELVGHEDIRTTMKYIHPHIEEVMKGGAKIGDVLRP